MKIQEMAFDCDVWIDVVTVEACENVSHHIIVELYNDRNSHEFRSLL
jgi:hypothetical protein